MPDCKLPTAARRHACARNREWYNNNAEAGRHPAAAGTRPSSRPHLGVQAGW